MTRRHDALLLDLDGTLLDTAPDMGGALNLLRQEHGLEPLPHSAIRPVVSHGAVRLVALGFPAATGNEFERLFTEIMSAAHPDFRQVKPQGAFGDRKNDGFEPMTAFH